jgi:hypothetical protein
MRRIGLAVALTLILFAASLAGEGQQALGLTIPQSLLVRADEVIQ